MGVWHRKGLLVSPPASHRWWHDSAGMPTCLPLHERLWRIWFGGRDAAGRAGVLCADVDPRDGMRVLAIRDVPGLERGPDGAFDSAGMGVSAALAVEGRVLLWYTGMRLRDDVPYELAIGLAVSDDDGLSFRKVGDGPVLASPPGQPGFVTTPCVRRTGSGYAMCFANGLGWRDVRGKREPFYDLRVAHSPDGIAWTVGDAPVVGIEGTAWAGLSRPWIEEGDDGATLWFGARGSADFRGPSADAYRIYRAPMDGDTVRAESIATIAFAPAPQPDDWDSWMQVAPCVVRDGTTRVLFYGGNDFSRSGFGWAVAEEAGA